MLTAYTVRDTIQPIKDPVICSDKITGAGKGKKVCLVTDSRHTVIPTAHQTAKWLASDGWKVTLLDLSPAQSMVGDANAPVKETKPYDHVRLKENFEERHWFTPAQSLCAYYWLKAREYDLIIFQHSFGVGHFSCMARKLGLAFTDTPIVVFGDFPTFEWLDDNQYISGNIRTDAECDFLERQTILNADGVFFTHQATLEWMVANGWRFPNQGKQVALLGEKGAQSWGKWFATIGKKKSTSAKQALAKISICVLAESAEPFQRLIKALQKQSKNPLEVVVVDANGNNPAIAKLQTSLAPLFGKNKWQWISKKGLSRADALNLAAKQAKGTHILFMDDDDTPTDDMLEIFAESASRSDAEILSSITGWHTHNDNALIASLRLPGRKESGYDHLMVAWIPYGPCLTVNMFNNVIGENVLYRRDTFLSLGGFDPTNGIYLTWGLVTRAATKKTQIEVIPEVLIQHARNKMQYGLLNDKVFYGQLSVLRDLSASVTPNLRPVFLAFVQGQLNARKINPGPIQDIDNVPADKRRPVPRAFQYRPKKSVPQIVLCASNFFIRPVCVTVASIFTNMPNVDVHVLSTFSAESTAKIKKLAKYFGREINIIRITPEMTANLPRSNLWGLGESTATYWRLLLPEYLPQLDRVIYLDSDVLVRRDLTDLWATDLEGKIMGGVLESSFPPGGGIYAALRQSFKGDYFNGGVMLVDLKKWKQEKIRERVLEWSEKLEGHIYKFGDQSPMNLALQGRWKVLPAMWNFSQWNPEWSSGEGLANSKLEGNQYHTMYDDPAIVHYLGPIKPWNEDGKRASIFNREYIAYMKMVDQLCGFANEKAA